MMDRSHPALVCVRLFVKVNASRPMRTNDATFSADLKSNGILVMTIEQIVRTLNIYSLPLGPKMT
jgi:hypothetical protein